MTEPGAPLGINRRHMIKRIGISLYLCVVLLAVLFVVFRLQAMTDLQEQFTVLHTEHRHMQQANEAIMKENSYRLDEIERALFGDVMAKLQQTKTNQKPSRVEVWQQNRDKELRDRIRRLEMWRLEHEIIR